MGFRSNFLRMVISEKVYHFSSFSTSGLMAFTVVYLSPKALQMMNVHNLVSYLFLNFFRIDSTYLITVNALFNKKGNNFFTNAYLLY